MSKKQSETLRDADAPEIDDLKLINGIGPAVERRLRGVGINTYAQLATLSPADIAAAVIGLSGLTAERITKQDWIGQARKLASKSTPGEVQADIEVPPEPGKTSLSTDKPEPNPSIALQSNTMDGLVSSPVNFKAELVGVPRLKRVEMIPAGMDTSQNYLPYGQPFDVRLTLDLSNVNAPGDTQLSYKASIYARCLEEPSRQVIGESDDIITFTDKFTISIGGTPLPKGTYRLKAVVMLNPVITESMPRAGLIASKESDLLLIF